MTLADPVLDRFRSSFVGAIELGVAALADRLWLIVPGRSSDLALTYQRRRDPSSGTEYLFERPALREFADELVGVAALLPESIRSPARLSAAKAPRRRRRLLR